jgi:hypothetical protein
VDSIPSALSEIAVVIADLYALNASVSEPLALGSLSPIASSAFSIIFLDSSFVILLLGSAFNVARKSSSCAVKYSLVIDVLTEYAAGDVRKKSSVSLTACSVRLTCSPSITPVANLAALSVRSLILFKLASTLFAALSSASTNVRLFLNDSVSTCIALLSVSSSPAP